MQRDHLSTSHPSTPSDGWGRLAAVAQLTAMAGVWLAVLPLAPVYAGGVWASRALKRRRPWRV